MHERFQFEGTQGDAINIIQHEPERG